VSRRAPDVPRCAHCNTVRGRLTATRDGPGAGAAWTACRPAFGAGYSSNPTSPAGP
jgi:hypothetical protein